MSRLPVLIGEETSLSPNHAFSVSLTADDWEHWVNVSSDNGETRCWLWCGKVDLFRYSTTHRAVTLQRTIWPKMSVHQYWEILTCSKKNKEHKLQQMNPKDMLSELSRSRMDAACWPFYEVPIETIHRDRRQTVVVDCSGEGGVPSCFFFFSYGFTRKISSECVAHSRVAMPQVTGWILKNDGMLFCGVLFDDDKQGCQGTPAWASSGQNGLVMKNSLPHSCIICRAHHPKYGDSLREITSSGC